VRKQDLCFQPQIIATNNEIKAGGMRPLFAPVVAEYNELLIFNIQF